ncbi:hypothetical protein CBM2625_U50027 [Cupriavidus taiwanensis]|nr:hypothetical protein CBM2625_U50027 [Cupriavidus taiwanensis]
MLNHNRQDLTNAAEDKPWDQPIPIFSAGCQNDTEIAKFYIHDDSKGMVREV